MVELESGQVLFNIALTTLLAIAGWAVRELWTTINETKRDLSRLRESLPQHYVSKTDYREDIAEIKQMLRDVREIIYHKADRED